MNSVSLLGRVGQSPEVKTLNGKNGEFKVCNNLSLAVRRDKDNTDWISCKVIGKTAEIVEKYVSKGDLLLIEGSLQVETWEKDNNKQTKTIVNVNKVHLLPKKDTSEVAKVEVIKEEIPF